MNQIDYQTPRASKTPTPRSTKHKNLIGGLIVLLAVGGYVGVSMVQSANRREAAREATEDSQHAQRIARAAELDIKAMNNTLTDDERAERAELRAREAKDTVEAIGK